MFINKKTLFLPFLAMPLFCGCAPNIKVNENEWKEAIENIVHVNKDNDLNYVASGSVVGKNTYSYGIGDSFELTKLECNKIVEKAYINIDYDGTGVIENELKYSEYLSKNINLVYTKHFNFKMSSKPNSYILSAIFDIYNYYSDFSFNKSSHRYECKSAYHGKSYFAAVKFSNEKKINELECDYSVLNDKQEYTTIKGKLSFKYSNCTLNKSEFPKNGDDSWDDVGNKLLVKFAGEDTSKKTYLMGSGAIILDNITNDNLKKIKCDEDYIFRSRPTSSSEIMIYQDGNLLVRGDKETGDYYLDDVETLIDFKSIVFKNSIKNKYIEIVYVSKVGLSANQYTISLMEPTI